MRHGNHRYILGVKKEHRVALMANLAVALITHGRIKTTLAKAKALRPFCEKIITLAKKAAASANPAEKLHYRRLAIARIRDDKAVALLFDTKVQEFVNRNGGYTRIYKLVPRRGDASSLAVIDLIDADDEGYGTSRKKKSRKAAPRAKDIKNSKEVKDLKAGETEAIHEQSQAHKETQSQPQE